MNKWQEHPVAIAVAAAAGALVLAGGLLAVGLLAAGDEPPIRVKNGSVDLELVTAANHWTDGPKTWKISGWLTWRRKDDLDVLVLTNTGGRCENGRQSARGKVLTVTYQDAQKTGTIVITSKGKHSSADAGSENLNQQDDQHLTYGTSGDNVFVSKITLDNNLTCTFENRGQFGEMWILDFPK